MIRLQFGPTAPSLAKQFEGAEIDVAPEIVEQWQQQSDAITLLLMHGMMTNAEATRLRKRIYADMEARVG